MKPAATAALAEWLGPDAHRWQALLDQVTGLPDAAGGICPDPLLLLQPFLRFAPAETRVVILGQDPYPAPGKANGLAFGINRGWAGVRLHSSFGNIAAEVRDEAGGLPVLLKEWATLEGWAEQGVLLLNTSLTCAVGQPASHAGMGWRPLVERLLRRVVDAQPRVVLVAWGAESRRMLRKVDMWDGVLAWSHPCKFSHARGSRLAPAFSGGRVFSRLNEELDKRGFPSVDWLRIPGGGI